MDVLVTWHLSIQIMVAVTALKMILIINYTIAIISFLGQLRHQRHDAPQRCLCTAVRCGIYAAYFPTAWSRRLEYLTLTVRGGRGKSPSYDSYRRWTEHHGAWILEKCDAVAAEGLRVYWYCFFLDPVTLASSDTCDVHWLWGDYFPNPNPAQSIFNSKDSLFGEEHHDKCERFLSTPQGFESGSNSF